MRRALASLMRVAAAHLSASANRLDPEFWISADLRNVAADAIPVEMYRVSFDPPLTASELAEVMEDQQDYAVHFDAPNFSAQAARSAASDSREGPAT